MIFTAQIVNHTLPAVSVIVADTGNGVSQGVTYAELKQSLGQQTYDVGCLYLYSDNQNQLSGVINYNIYDANGNAKVTNVVTTIDPYQFVGSLLVNLKDKVNMPIILNGNSSVSTTVQPNTYFQIKFLADRINNKLGLINSNFAQMQDITNTKFFENTYSDAGNGCNSGTENLLTSQEVKKQTIIKVPPKAQPIKEPNYYIFLLIASVSAGLYIMSKDN